MLKNKHGLLVLCVVLMLINLLFIESIFADFEQYQNDPAHTGYVPVEPVMSPVILWVHPLPVAIYSSPVVSEGILYVGANDNQVHAIDVASGFGVWNYTTDGSVISTPAIGLLRVYFGSLDGKVYAVDKFSGLQLWNFTCGDAVYSSPTIDVAAGVIYVGSDDGYLYALNASSGSAVWSFTGHAGIISSLQPLVKALFILGVMVDLKVHLLFTL